ncbi:MAG: twin-arginine translocase subunit TatC [Alphaproteobacteria bacterium]|nr:twin-arginine translocase subunit TatC [Alphaproteobacteria bacterium]MBP9777167.1 twin-arginine translocase subunit TatC [Alphaproteobacteria bacterium]
MQKPLLEHLIELRIRLIYSLLALIASMAVCYPFAPPLFQFLTAPLWHAMGEEEGRRMIYTGLTEAFLTYLKVTFFAGFVLAFPFILWQAWVFVAPGLYDREKKTIWPFLALSPFLFLAGACLAYYVVCPWAWHFFLSFEMPTSPHTLSLQLEARMGEYLTLILKLIMAFGLCFQLPLILVGLVQLGFLTLESLKRNRKYAFLSIVIVAALITPPDIISPLSLIIPLYTLYEISIGLVKLSSRRKGLHCARHKVDSRESGSI